MNFKFLIYYFFLLLLAGCGVKAKPLQKPETAIDSYIESYTLPADLKEMRDQNLRKK